MNTKVVRIESEGEGEKLIAEAGQVLKKGGLVAFPTETVYGLGGDALNPMSSQKIYAAKGRPSDNPLIVHICKWEDLEYIAANIPLSAEKLAKAFWPGPLTMILPKAITVPFETTGGLDTVAVRMPNHPVALALIEAAGGFVAAPSANTSGKPSPTQAKYVYEDMDGKIEMIVDGGEVGIGLESTIVDLTCETPEILRPGFITKEMLEEVLGRVETDEGSMSPESGQAPRAPGMRYRHYAPQGDLTIVSGNPVRVAEYIVCQLINADIVDQKTAVICTDETQKLYPADIVKSVGSRQNEDEIARGLYRILRELDDEGAEVIYSEAFDEQGIGQAIMNRLLKAAGHHIVYV